MLPSKSNGIRVALATCHDKRNFGSMLQAYATRAYLENRGYEAMGGFESVERWFPLDDKVATK